MQIKKIITVIITSLSFSNVVYAATPGVYLGAGGGYSVLSNFSDATRQDNGEVGGQLMLGYNFNRYIGVEMGYRLFGTTNYKVKNYSNLTFDYHLHGISLVAKGYFPLSEKSPLDFYALLGAAEMYGKGDIFVDSEKRASLSANALVATAGLGMSYNINNQITTSLEYAFTGGKNGNQDQIGIPQSNLLTINLAYHFG